MSNRRISIILPAFNEAETIDRVIEEIPRQQLENTGYLVHIIVVDNNSRDDTGKIARASGAEVIFEPRQGKGRAVKTALQCCNSDFIFMLDSDYTYPATYIPKMQSLLENGYAVVIGSRLSGTREAGAMSRLNLIGNYILTKMATILYMCKTTDLCTGMWGFRSTLVKSLDLTADGFDLEANIYAQIAHRHLAIGQVPIYYRCRSNQAKLASLKDGWRIGLKLVVDRFNRNGNCTPATSNWASPYLLQQSVQPVESFYTQRLPENCSKVNSRADRFEMNGK
jgi:dolichol-phosphate hexosyltransferase